MYVTHRRTEGNHIEVGILRKEESALETCVDSLDLGILAEELAIGALSDLENLRVGVRRPAGIAVTYLCARTG